MSRSLCIDYLRFIGLSLIILAHVNPPRIVFHLRCFDVCLMLFVSGLAYSGRLPDFSPRFFKNRFKRLVVPVYLFLSVYFALVIFLESLGLNLGLKKEYILGSYLLTGGIGYVWIIRVFLMVSFLTPFLLKLDNVVKSHSVYIAIVLCIMVFVDYLIKNNIGTENYIIRQYVYYALGYSSLFLFGLRVRRLSTKAILGISIVVLLSSVAYWGGVLAY